MQHEQSEKNRLRAFKAWAGKNVSAVVAAVILGACATTPPLPQPPPPLTAQEQEARDWRLSAAEDSIAGYERYLRFHPTGPNAAAATARMAVLTEAEPAAYRAAQTADVLRGAAKR